MRKDQSNLIKWATKYVNLGWPVLPVHGIINGRCTCGNSECKSQGKHPLTAHGCKDATLDIATIEEWFRRWPYANIAVITGSESGIIAIDIDGTAGEESLKKLTAEYGLLPLTPKQRTGNGCHFIFCHPGEQIKNAVKIMKGIDVRGDGGYIIVAPSSHWTGAHYMWENDPSQVPLANIPDWLLILIDKPVGQNVIKLEQECKEAKEKEIRESKEPKVVGGEIIPVGQRNDTLTRIAGSLYHKGATHEQVAEELMRINLEQTEEPLPDKEVMTITQSIGTREERRREQLAKIRERTDIGNAQRVIDRYGADLRVKMPEGQFMWWNGKTWQEAPEAVIGYMIKETVLGIKEEAMAVADEGERELLLEWYKRSQSGHAKTQTLKWLKDFKELWVADTTFETQSKLWVFKNGTYELDNRKFREHRREDYLIYSCPYNYNPAATCPTWDRVLLEVWDGDEEMISFFYRVLGYCMMGGNPDQLLFFLHGSGANGKTLILETVRELWGDYAGVIAGGTLLESVMERHPTELALFEQKRLMIEDEVARGRNIDEDKLKKLTGRRVMVYRKMRENYKLTKLTHKIIWAVNKKPDIRSTDIGTWRRIIVVPCPVTIPVEKRDKFLLDKVLVEGEGILQKIIAGYNEWRERGIDPPQIALTAASQYRSDQDIFGWFLEECCIVAEGLRIEANQIQNKAKQWYIDNGLRPLSYPRVKQELQDRGIYKGFSNGVGVYYGIALKPEMED